MARVYSAVVDINDGLEIRNAVDDQVVSGTSWQQLRRPVRQSRYVSSNGGETPKHIEYGWRCLLYDTWATYLVSARSIDPSWY